MYTLLMDRQNGIWIGHSTGLIVFRPDDPGPSGSVSVRQLPLTPASSSSRTTRLPTLAGEAIRFTSADGVSGQVLELHQDSNDAVCIGTSEGLSRLDGAKSAAPTTIHGIAFASAIAEDKSRHIWVGGDGAAVRLARTGFVKYTEADGLSNTLIRSVFEADDGELRVVTRRQLIHRFDGTRFTAVRPNLSKDRIPVEAAVPVLQDRAGEWWVPGEAGLYRFPRAATHEQLARVSPKAVYTSRDGLAGEDIFRLFEDSHGDIWISRRLPTRTVLTRWNRATETFQSFFDTDGLPPYQRAGAFGEDRTGSVWIGFWGGGIARFRDGRFPLFTAADGAPHGSISDLRGRGRAAVDRNQRRRVPGR